MDVRKSQAGFSTLEVILIIVIVAIIAGVGGYVLRAKKNSDASLNSAAKTATNSTAAAPKSVPLTAQSAQAFAQKVYDTDLAAWSTGESAMIKSHQDWFTGNFLSNSINRTPSMSNDTGLFLLCGNGVTRPDTFRATNPVLASDNQTATVDMQLLYGTAPSPGPTVHLQAAHSSWQIDSRDCAPRQ